MVKIIIRCISPNVQRDPPNKVRPSHDQSTAYPINFATASPTKIGIIVAEEMEDA